MESSPHRSNLHEPLCNFTQPSHSGGVRKSAGCAKPYTADSGFGSILRCRVWRGRSQQSHRRVPRSGNGDQLGCPRINSESAVFRRIRFWGGKIFVRIIECAWISAAYSTAAQLNCDISCRHGSKDSNRPPTAPVPPPAKTSHQRLNRDQTGSLKTNLSCQVSTRLRQKTRRKNSPKKR